MHFVFSVLLLLFATTAAQTITRESIKVEAGPQNVIRTTWQDEEHNLVVITVIQKITYNGRYMFFSPSH